MEKQELHIDFKVAKAAFEKYLDEYDRTDDKILTHPRKVMIVEIGRAHV